MTGRELALVVLVSAVAGGGAALGAGLLSSRLAEPAAAGREDALARIEAALGRIQSEQEEIRRTSASLNDRVTGLAIDVNSAREEARRDADEAASDAAVEPEARPGRVRRPRGDAVAAGPQVLEFDRSVVQADGTRVTLDRLGAALSQRMSGITEGMRLRLLPEEKRWEQARSDMNLSDAQVEELRRAVADRDEALKGAMDVQTTGDGTEQQITIRRMDPLKAAAAQQEWDRRVSTTLDQDQKKKWDEKGWGHAFGGPSGGRTLAVVHSIPLQTEGRTDER